MEDIGVTPSTGQAPWYYVNINKKNRLKLEQLKNITILSCFEILLEKLEIVEKIEKTNSKNPEVIGKAIDDHLEKT